MRPIICVITLLLPPFFCTQIQAQQHLQKKPDKDPVMVIDKLLPGKSKHYNWHSDSIKFTIRNNDKDCKKVKVTFNNKPLLQHHCLAKEKSFTRRLSKHTNFILLTSEGDNTTDSIFASVMLSGATLPYTINVLCRKNINDSIFISH